MIDRLPPLPPRFSKALVDHLDPVFVERRRILLGRGRFFAENFHSNNGGLRLQRATFGASFVCE